MLLFVSRHAAIGHVEMLPIAPSDEAAGPPTCEAWKVDAAPSYALITEDQLQQMPWTRHRMTKAELENWRATRKEAGRAIDIETCELGRWGAYDCDPYGVRDDLPEDIKQVGTNRFVRSPTSSNGWVNEEDLPFKKYRAMYDRIDRESDCFPF